MNSGNISKANVNLFYEGISINIKFLIFKKLSIF